MSTALLTTSEARVECGDVPCGESVVCRCLNVTEGEVQMALSTYNVQTVRELGRCTGAGKGCMACHSRLRALITQRNS
jgi:bacterioferritin-associated ferredoxin